ncbi:MAG: type II toxin-antitoxin system VapC family toxin [Chloroflexi bacterium]|nr:type II toxin-antitoxin system VapC family toxin [Chloroflexota bacterium]
MAEALQLVLDASALLAVIQQEPGAQWVEQHLRRAAISTVNWAEVWQRGLARGTRMEGLREEFEAWGLTIAQFTVEDAEACAALWSSTRRLGLSLGDRACLALGRRLGLPVATTDRAWGRLDIGVEVHLVR